MKERWMRGCVAAVFALACCAAPDRAVADAVVLAEDGRAKAEIVIPEQPSAYVRFAAEELKHYLDRITGGDFPIVNRPTAEVRIWLGRSAEAETAGLDPDTLETDGFFIHVQGRDVCILGQDNPVPGAVNYFHLFYDEDRRGTLLGTYEFLEQVGVRWPAPGPENAFVPQRPTLRISEGTRKIEPFFADRKLGRFFAFMRRNPDAHDYADDVTEAYRWGVRLKFSGRGHRVEGSHSETALKLQEGSFFEGHPERMALVHGERNPRYTCWSDPALKELWERAADVYLSGRPPAEAGLGHLRPYLSSSWPWPFMAEDEFMIDPADHDRLSDGRCRCDRCHAFRENHPGPDDTELLWRVIAYVAESVREIHPGKFITTLVYPPKMEVPRQVDVPDNVRVRICIRGPLHVPTPERLERDLERIRDWSEAMPGFKPPLWTYQVTAAHGRRIPGMPETYPRLFAEFLDLVRDDISGMYYEQVHPNHTYRNLDLYLAARLLWDPSRDVEEELADYYRAYYGPAAEEAQRLFDRLEQNWITFWKRINQDTGLGDGALGIGMPRDDLQRLAWTEIYDRDEMRKIEAMVADIEAAAAGDPVYRKRAGLLRTWIFDVMEKERQAAIGAFAHLLPGRAIVQSFPLPTEKWQFKRDPADLGRARGWYHADHPDEDWESIGIGKAWGHFGHEGYIGAGWYRRTFDLPEQGDARDALLLFEGVDETAHVWINGRYAGEHDRGPDGWNQPFSVEITEHVSWGAANQITVRARNTLGAGGIWRPITVYLLKSTP